MENKHYPSVSPAMTQGPFPTSAMPAMMNAPMAPMQVSPAAFENAHVMGMGMGKGKVSPAAVEPYCAFNPAIVLVLFILLVIVLRGVFF